MSPASKLPLSVLDLAIVPEGSDPGQALRNSVELVLGTWQGIYLCEHRDAAGPRTLVGTLWGE